MLLALDAGVSRVLIDLRATGPLAVLGHDPTLTARPDAFSIDVAEKEGGGAEASVEARFAVGAIEPPAGISASDRTKMRDNLLSRDVLDAGRFPTIVLRGRYSGTFDAGTLAGDLVVRGAQRGITVPVRIVREPGVFSASGRWEGRLTDLGVKPFKALLGALKLEDWVVLRLEARFKA
jgi:hypothetical protein